MADTNHIICYRAFTMENNEMTEEINALRHGFDETFERLEAMEAVLEELIRFLMRNPSNAITWAKKLDHMVEKFEQIEPEHAGIKWLLQLRDDLVSWHDIAPHIQKAIKEGKIRYDPRLRFRVLDGDVEKSPSTPSVPGLSDSGEPHG
jgi:hypothetical protein